MYRERFVEGKENGGDGDGTEAPVPFYLLHSNVRLVTHTLTASMRLSANHMGKTDTVVLSLTKLNSTGWEAYDMCCHIYSTS